MATRTYILPPKNQSGLLLGLTFGQLLIIGAGGFVTLVAINTIGGIRAVIPIAASYGIAKARIGGLLLVEWVPVLLHWLQVRRSLPMHPTKGDGELSSAEPLRGITVEDIDNSIGVVVSPDNQTLTAVIEVAAPTVNALLPDDDIIQMLDGWGTVLATHAKFGSPVARIGWTEVCRTASEDDHLAWVDSVGNNRDEALKRDYLQIVRSAAPTTTSHTVYLSVVVDAGRLTRRHWSAGVNESNRGDKGASNQRLAEALVRSVRVTNEALRKADLSPHTLTSAEINDFVDSAVDPDHARSFAPRVGALSQRLRPGARSPLSEQTVTPHWYATDHVLHRSYQIFDWPRQPQTAGWLLDLLVLPLTARRMTVWFAPVEARSSYQRINRELAKLEADATLADDKGKRVTAVTHRAVEAAQDREAELVDGFAEADYVGVVTISRATLEGLVADCEAFEAAAMQTGIELRALDRQHDLGWGASLPFGIPVQQGSLVT